MSQKEAQVNKEQRERLNDLIMEMVGTPVEDSSDKMKLIFREYLTIKTCEVLYATEEGEFEEDDFE